LLSGNQKDPFEYILTQNYKIGVIGVFFVALVGFSPLTNEMKCAIIGGYPGNPDSGEPGNEPIFGGV